MTDDTHGRSGTARGLGRIVSGLFILTTGEGEQATGMLASFVQQAGFEPPAVTVAVKKDRGVLDQLRSCGRFCISILHDESMSLLAHFARGFEPGQPAFENVTTATAANGVPYLADAHAHIACEVVGEADWTDHIVFCGVVVGGDRSDDDQPLTHVRKDGLKYEVRAMPPHAAGIVLAAGRGRRMGQDKALLELGGQTAIERVTAACRAGGVGSIFVVRAAAAAPLPAAVEAGVTTVAMATPGEMIDTVCAGLDALGLDEIGPDAPGPAAAVDLVLVFPVDYALVAAVEVQAVVDGLASSDGEIALPTWEDRPGHPIALRATVAAEIRMAAAAGRSLRDVVVAASGREKVIGVPVGNPWVRRDLDTPEDAAAARAWLTEHPSA